MIQFCDERLDMGQRVRITYKQNHYLVPLSFIRSHPGGKGLILSYANDDITSAFEAAGHSKTAALLLDSWLESAPRNYEAESLEKVNLLRRESEANEAEKDVFRFPSGSSAQEMWQSTVLVMSAALLVTMLSLRSRLGAVQ